MNGYNFTHGVRRALARAREEAARLHHEYVGTEHVLLGMLIDRPSIALDIIDQYKIPVADIRNRIEDVIQVGKSMPRGPDLPYTSRAKKCLELAMSEARELNSSEVSTGHLLLGLLREEKGVAAQLLVDMGMTLNEARARFVELTTDGRKDDEGAGPPRYISPAIAATYLKAMGASPTIAAIFAQHEIDLPTLIEDVRNAP